MYRTKQSQVADTLCRASQVATDWSELVSRAQAVYDQLPEERKASFFEVVLSHTELLANLNEMYISGKPARTSLISADGLLSGQEQPVFPASAGLDESMGSQSNQGL